LTLTEGAKADLIRNFCVPEGRIAVLRSNAVLTPETERHLAASAAVSESQREPGLIVSVGRLSPEKDQLVILEAMARLQVHRPVRLLLIGDGMLREELEKRAAELQIADRVTFAGYLEDPFSWLLRAEVAVCSSRFEGFGNAIVEALACGTPVISTDCPWGPREILADGHYGTLVPVGDADALARAISDQIGVPVNRDSLRSRASAFTSGAAATALLDVLSSYRLEPAPAAR
jgi:glycosyltransferase involved in cell wall biosynthesis